MTGVANAPSAFDPCAVVRRIIQGDRDAEAKMIAHYQPSLVYTLRKRCGDAQVADDVVQETWRLVIEKLRANALRDHTKLAAFVLQIGRNQLLMSYRKNRPHEGDDELAEMASKDTEPPTQVERDEEAANIRVVLGELNNARDRELLLRFYLAEEDKSAICRDLGVTELHFNRILFRARQRFKSLWQRHSK